MSVPLRPDDPRLSHLTPAEREVVVRFYEHLEREIPGRVERLILFGSKARGDGHSHSDVDLLLIVDRYTPEINDVIIAGLPELAVGGPDLQVVTFGHDEAEELIAIGTPFMRNVADDGIVLKGEQIVVKKGDRLAVAKRFIASAYGRLRVAEAACDIGEYGNAMSLVYYAFLDAGDAALALRGIRTKSHAGTITLIGKHFIKPGTFPVKYIKWFRRAKKYREEADYERRRDFTPEQVAQAIAEAEEFVKVVEALIERDEVSAGRGG